MDRNRSTGEDYTEAIAGAGASVIRQRLPALNGNPDGSSLPVYSSASPPRTTFQTAAGIRSSAKRPIFSPPSLFESARRRPKKRKSAAEPSKNIVHYVRDVILLPMEYRNRNGEISFPRGSKRNRLGKAGLVGKMELHSAMSDTDVRREICEVFCSPMGLNDSDIKAGELFPFSYLQRAGTGSRSLCKPSVKESFEWSGRQVASLAKAGCFVYLLAEATLPGYQLLIKKEYEDILSSDDEIGDCENARGSSEDDDLPDPFLRSDEQNDEVIFIDVSSSSQPSSFQPPLLSSQPPSSLPSLPSSQPQPLSSQPLVPSAHLPPSSQPTLPSAQPPPSSQPTLPSAQPPPSSQPTLPSAQPPPSSQPTPQSAQPPPSSQPTLQSAQLPSSSQPPSAQPPSSSQPVLPSAQPPPSSQPLSAQPPSSSQPVLPSAQPPSSSQPALPSSQSVAEQHQASWDKLMNYVGVRDLTLRQISAIFNFSGHDYEETANCLNQGPTFSAIKKMTIKRFDHFPRVKINLERADLFHDMVALYKSPMNHHCHLAIKLDNGPSIDTGGVRRLIYSKVFEEFASNKFIGLFEGPLNYLRPKCTAEARSSGLLKVLGSMIAHSICQDGHGFPYLSPTCYAYLIGGEDRALELMSLEDLPADSASVVSLLKDAKSTDDLKRLSSSNFDIFTDVLQRCGINQVVQMSNKAAVAQEILSYEAIGRISKLLDQLIFGLKKLGILQIMRAFPDLFAPLFVYTASISSVDVIEAIYIDACVTEVQAGDVVVFDHLKYWITEASTDSLKKFLRHVTGAIFPYPESIQIDFMDEVEYGAISAHTCANLITFPRNIFVDTPESRDDLCLAIDAIIAGDEFNFNTI